jgi:hypothetical protein
MRLTCFIAALLLGAGALCADEPANSRKLEADQGFVRLFDGKTLNGWQGSTQGYGIKNGVLICKKREGKNLFTRNEYGNFIFRFEYKLEPGGNNGVGIRAPLKGEPAYTGMEIQVLDDTSPRWEKCKPWQFNGSIYGVAPCKRGHLKPVGQWNAMEIRAEGPKIKVTLNGTVIVDADLDKIGDKTPDGEAHPGLHRKKGHIGFCGHGDRVEFRNIRIKTL